MDENWWADKWEDEADENACDESYRDYREDFHADDAIGVVNYGQDGPFGD